MKKTVICILALCGVACVTVSFASAQEPPAEDARLTEETRLDQAVERLVAGYEQGRIEEFREMLSERLPEKGAWLDRLQREFLELRNIRVYYSVERKASDPEGGVQVRDLFCRRKALDSAGNPAGEVSAVFSLRFELEDGEWRVTGIRESSA